MNHFSPGFTVSLLVTLCLLAGCLDVEPECAWVMIDFTDCPVAVIDCPSSLYYGANGYNLRAAFGECTSYGSRSGPDGEEIQASTDKGCISEERMLVVLCGE